MWRTLLILILPLTCWSQAFTLRDPAIKYANPASGPACSTVSQDNMGDTGNISSSIWFGNNTTKIYNGMAFYNSNTITMCKISLQLKLGSGPGQYYVSIYTGSTQPATMISSEVGPFNFTDLSASFTTNTFTISVALPAGTTNWVVIRATGTDSNSFMYENGWNNNSLVPPYDGNFKIWWSPDAVTWTDSGATKSAACTVYH